MMTKRLTSLGLVQPLILMSIRGTALLSKVALSFYIARYLDLQTLGYYGYLTGAVSILPIALGFGVIQKASRRIAAFGLDEGLPILKRYWAITALIYVFFGAIAVAISAIFETNGLTPKAWSLITLVLAFEHFNNDAYSISMSMHRPLFANIQVFVRASLWIFLAMGISYVNPKLRTFDFLLTCWFIGVLISLLCFALCCERKFISKLISRDKIERPRLFANFSPALYAGDSINAATLFVDRYLVGFFLGTHSAGIYSFYSSIALGAYNLANSGVMQVIRPKLVKLYFENRDEEYAALHRQCMRKSLLSSLLLCVTSAIVLLLVLPHTGSVEISENVWIAYILLAGVIARIASDVQGYVFYTREADLLFTKTVAFAAIVLILLDIALIKSAGLPGAALAFLITYMATYVLRSFIIYKAKKNEPARH